MKQKKLLLLLVLSPLALAGCDSASPSAADAAAPSETGAHEDTGSSPASDALVSQDTSAPDTLPPEPGTSWAKALGGAGSDEATGLALDAQGNIYLTGSFSDTIDFGDGPLTSQGEADVFVVSYDPAGNLRWASRFGGAGADQGRALAVGGDAVLLTGGFESGALEIDGTRLQNSGGEDIFLLNLDLQGNVRWAKAFGGAEHERPTAVAVDSGGNIALTGFFRGELDLGGQLLKSNSTFDWDIFVASYRSDGVLRWGKRFGNGLDDRSRAITCDGQGGVILSGEFSYAIDFGGGMLEGTGTTTDAFVVSFASDGAYRWATTFGGDEYDSAHGVAVDQAGQVVVVGQFGEWVQFGDESVRASGKYDAFLAGLDASGALRWHKILSSAGPDRGYGVALDAAGNAYFTGSFQETAAFPGGELQSAGGSDVYLVSYGSDGAFRWAERLGGADYDSAAKVAVGPAGEAVVCGYFEGEMAGPVTTLTSQGGRDIFLWRHVAR